jgi:hypothetical protein
LIEKICNPIHISLLISFDQLNAITIAISTMVTIIESVIVDTDAVTSATTAPEVVITAADFSTSGTVETTAVVVVVVPELPDMLGSVSVCALLPETGLIVDPIGVGVAIGVGAFVMTPPGVGAVAIGVGAFVDPCLVGVGNGVGDGVGGDSVVGDGDGLAFGHVHIGTVQLHVGALAQLMQLDSLSGRCKSQLTNERGNAPTSPVSRLPKTAKYWRLDSRAIADGSVPDNLLLRKKRFSSLVKLPMNSGIVPEKRLACK